jgi:ABC-type branched-subunit amino acid transport system substrate-binding protein
MMAGVSISLTGRYARQGRQALDALRMWADRTGRHLVHYDDESSARRTRDNVRRLIEQDGVTILFGPYSSGLALAAAEVAGQHRRLMWNHGGSSDDIAGDWVVSTPSPASQYFLRLPSWLARNAPDLRRITIMRSNRGTFAGHVARGLAEEAEARALSTEIVSIDIAAAPATDILVLAGSFEEEVRIMRLRPAARTVAAVAAGVRAFQEELGSAADGVIGPSQWEPDSESEWFVDDFRKRFGRAPEYMAAGAFATGLVVDECLRRADSADDSRLRQAAAELDLRTFFGRYRIDPTSGRQTGHDILLVRWMGGRKVVIERLVGNRC